LMSTTYCSLKSYYFIHLFLVLTNHFYSSRFILVRNNLLFNFAFLSLTYVIINCCLVNMI
uniref:Ovule protein n=1 Tax=Strongyloides venezuelensis TaxID=75913 RepID=A0A0K0ETY2_STRVS